MQVIEFLSLGQTTAKRIFITEDNLLLQLGFVIHLNRICVISLSGAANTNYCVGAATGVSFVFERIEIIPGIINGDRLRRSPIKLKMFNKRFLYS